MKTVGDAEVERRVVPCSTWSETFVPVLGKEIEQITVDGVPQTITDPLSHTVTQTGGSAEIRVRLRKPFSLKQHLFGGAGITGSTVNSVIGPAAQLVNSNSLTFDGVNDAVTLPNIALGSGDWSVEGWLNFNSIATSNQAVYLWSNGANIMGLIKETNGFNNQLYFLSAKNRGVYLGFIPNVGQWYNWEIQKVGTTVSCLINDVVMGSFGGDVTNYTTSTSHFLGRWTIAIFFFNGSLANLKIIVAGVTSQDYSLQEGAGDRVFSKVGGHIGTLTNFTFPDAWANTQDVVHSNLIDGFDAITHNNGTGYLTSPNSTDYNMTGDWAVDFWVRTTQNGTFIVNQFTPPPYNGWLIGIGAITANRLDLMVFSGNSSIIALSSTSNINTGVWVHCAISKSGTDLRMYVNGIQEGSVTSDGANGAANLTMFTSPDPLNTSLFNGHIANLRIWKKNKFTGASFAVPTTEADYQDTVNLSFFLRGIQDRSPNNRTITSVGTQTSLARKPITATNPQTASNIAGDWHNNAETEIIQTDNSLDDADGFWFPGGFAEAKSFEDFSAATATGKVTADTATPHRLTDIKTFI